MRRGASGVVGLLLGGLLALGCGDQKKTATDAELCSKARRLCPPKVAVCFEADDWSQAARDVGDGPVAKYRSCLINASDCGDLVGCMTGLGFEAARVGGIAPR